MNTPKPKNQDQKRRFEESNFGTAAQIQKVIECQKNNQKSRAWREENQKTQVSVSKKSLGDFYKTIISKEKIELGWEGVFQGAKMVASINKIVFGLIDKIKILVVTSVFFFKTAFTEHLSFTI